MSERPSEPASDPTLPLETVRTSGALAARAGRRSALLRLVRVLPFAALLVFGGALAGMYFQPPGLRIVMKALGLVPGGGSAQPIAVAAPVTEPPAVKPRFVAGLARLVPEGEVITLAMPFGAGDARLATLRVREGDAVAAGTVLATLDNEKPLQSALDLAKANLTAREAILAQVRAATEASRSEAQAALARAQATAQNAVRELERVTELRQRGVAADQSFDQKRTARDESQREVERAKATLSRFGEGDIERQKDVIVATRNVAVSRAELERAEADLDKAMVRAPQAATVLTLHARPGERPGTQGIMTLGNIDAMRADVEIYQAQIALVRLGAAVTLTAEALPRPLTGTVERIGLEVVRQTLIDPSPAANTDARVMKVRVMLDGESARLARAFTNLQVLARVEAAP